MVRRAILWSFIGQVATFGGSMAALVVLSRLLSPREIGIYAIGLAICGLLQALSSFGVATYIVREAELSSETLSSAFTVNLLVSIVLATVLFVAGGIGRVTGHEPMVGQVIRLLALLPLLSAIEFRPATMLQREMNFRQIGLVTIARTMATAVVSIAAALAGASSLSAAYGGLAGGVVGAVGFSAIARHHASARLSLAGWRRIAGFGVKTLLIGGIAVVVFRATDILLGSLLGLVALGYYSRAVTLASVTIQNVYASIARVMFVKLADDHRAQIPLSDSYLRGLDMILAVMWPMLAGLAVLSGPAVVLLFGAAWLPAAWPLALLSMVQVFGLSFAMNYELFVLRDRIGEQARYETIRAIGGLAVFAWGCSFGLVGAAASRLADPLIGMMLYLPRIPGLVDLRPGRLARTFLRNIAITVVTIAPATGMMAWAGWSAHVGLGWVVLTVAMGGVAWLAMLRLLRHPLYDELSVYLERLRAAKARTVTS